MSLVKVWEEGNDSVLGLRKLPVAVVECVGFHHTLPAKQFLASHPIPNHLPLFPEMVSPDKESAAHILSRKGGGNLLSIVVGGIQEALTARPGAYKLVLQNRKGFIRLTLIHGYREEGSEFSWILARIVFWREDCRGKCRFYFVKESLNPLTMKSLSW